MPPPFLEALVGEVIDDLCAFREREGEALHRALVELHTELERHVDELQRDAPLGMERAVARLRERVGELLTREGVAEPERAMADVVLWVARGDVEEELTRLRSHLSQMGEILAAPAKRGQGKTLDFLCQELQREVSTIASKTASHDSSRRVIDARTTIERIREQVQNVE